MCPEHLTREASGRHPNDMNELPHLSPLGEEEWRLNCELLLDGRASHPIHPPAFPSSDAGWWTRTFSKPFGSRNSSHAWVFASASATAAHRLACRFPSAASGVPHTKKAQWDSLLSLTASFSAGVYQQARELPPQQAPSPYGRLNNGGTEQGPLALDVPRDMVEAPREVRVGASSDSGLCQAFWTDPYYMFGSYWQTQTKSTHHQVVVGWKRRPFLHLHWDKLVPRWDYYYPNKTNNMA